MRRYSAYIRHAALALALSCSRGTASPTPEVGRFSVLLQGEALERIRRAVHESGGQVTHDLPIISALGANLTRPQLETLRALPFVERVIDDLNADPEPEAQSDCRLGAGLELQWEGPTATWELFGKAARPVPVERIHVRWPGELGTLEAVVIDRQALDLPEHSDKTASLVVPANPASIAPRARAALRLTFSEPPTDSPYATQNAMELSVDYGDGCSLTLVPSYLFPDADSYYPITTGADVLHATGITGAGVGVAVLDSGLWEERTELTHNTLGEPRVRARYDAIHGSVVEVASDESGHGSHMTSILARSDPATATATARTTTSHYRGIAPDAEIIVVKAFDRSGEAHMLDLIRAVQWIVDNRNRYGIRVINLSFSNRPRWPYWDDPLNQALMRAWQAGLTLVAAAGNDGPEAMTIGSPGNLPYLITVGAVTDSWTPWDRSDDYIPDFSSRGPTPAGHVKPDVLSYGGHMAGFVPANSSLVEELPEYRSSRNEFVMTGTSQAAAVVSGLVALMLEVDPELSNDAIKCMLTTSAEPAISIDGKLAYSPFQQGHGLASIKRALTLGEQECDTSAMDIAADIDRRSHYYGPAVFKEGEAVSLPDEDTLVSDTEPEKGQSKTRAWGVGEHLRRFDAPPPAGTVDWLGIYRKEQRRLRDLSRAEK